MVDEITEDAMNSVAFLDISHEMLCSVLERDTLTVHEFNIYQAVDRWAEHQCKKQQREVSGEEKRKILGDAVNLIRFPLMSEEEFSSLVPKTKVLTERRSGRLALREQRNRFAIENFRYFTTRNLSYYKAGHTIHVCEYAEPKYVLWFVVRW